MKKITIVLALVVGFALAPTDSRAEEPLFVGIAAIDATPPVGVPLAGYGDRRIYPWDFFNKHKWSAWMKPSEGILDPIRAKVMILKKGQQHLVFISVDTVAVTSRVLRDILKRLSIFGIKREELFLSATHTHAGPGTLSRNLFWNLVTMDRFRKDIYTGFIDKVESVAITAYNKLAEAQLHTVSFDAVDIQRNRRKKPGNIDPQANILMAQAASGAWLGGLVNFAVHGTSLKSDNMKYSADINGRIEVELAKRVERVNLPTDPKPEFLFINGAEGDVIPKKGGFDEMIIQSESFADQALDAMEDLRPVEAEWSTQMSQINLGSAGLNLAGCAKTKMKSNFFSKLFWKFRLYLGWALPKKFRLTMAHLGDILIMTWPGEPTTNLGRNLRKMAEKYEEENAWVFGLTNDHGAYWTDPDEYIEGGYEACASFYGKHGGTKIIDRYEELLKKM